jgi:hypothetical protein
VTVIEKAKGREGVPLRPLLFVGRTSCHCEEHMVRRRNLALAGLHNIKIASLASAMLMKGGTFTSPSPLPTSNSLPAALVFGTNTNDTFLDITIKEHRSLPMSPLSCREELTDV